MSITNVGDCLMRALLNLLHLDVIANLKMNEVQEWSGRLKEQKNRRMCIVFAS